MFWNAFFFLKRKRFTRVQSCQGLLREQRSRIMCLDSVIWNECKHKSRNTSLNSSFTSQCTVQWTCAVQYKYGILLIVKTIYAWRIKRKWRSHLTSRATRRSAARKRGITLTGDAWVSWHSSPLLTCHVNLTRQTPPPTEGHFYPSSSRVMMLSTIRSQIYDFQAQTRAL